MSVELSTSQRTDRNAFASPEGRATADDVPTWLGHALVRSMTLELDDQLLAGGDER